MSVALWTVPVAAPSGPPVNGPHSTFPPTARRMNSKESSVRGSVPDPHATGEPSRFLFVTRYTSTLTGKNPLSTSAPVFKLSPVRSRKAYCADAGTDVITRIRRRKPKRSRKEGTVFISGSLLSGHEGPISVDPPQPFLQLVYVICATATVLLMRVEGVSRVSMEKKKKSPGFAPG